MRKSLERDLADAGDAVETVLRKYPDMTMQEKVDCAARLKAVTKNAAKFDERVKADIKKKLSEKEGTVLGETFKALLKLVPVHRFNQSSFKEAEPSVFESYCEDKDEPRISFEPR